MPIGRNVSSCPHYASPAMAGLLGALLGLAPQATAVANAAPPPTEAGREGEAPPDADSGSDQPQAAKETPESLASLLASISREAKRADDLDSNSLAALEHALGALRKHTFALANDDAAQATQMTGLLTLARAQLALGNETAAAEAVDEAFRCSGGRPLDAEAYGPRLSTFVASRSNLQRTTAQIDVRCEFDCEVYIQERPSLSRTKLAKGGPYRLLIRATRPADRERYPEAAHEFVLDGDRTFAWPMDRGPDGVLRPATTPKGEGPHRPARQARGADSSGRERRRFDARANKRAIGLGAGALALGLLGLGLGSALLGLDGRCQGGGSVTGLDACPGLYATSSAGAVSLSVGAIIMVSGIATVAVAGSRKRRALRREN